MINRIVYWNIDRNHTKFDRELETEMLNEEAQEFKEAYEAFKSEPNIDNMVDMIDAVCDYKFVLVGSLYKSLDNRADFSKYESKHDFMINLLFGIFNNMAGISESEFYKLINKSMEFVIEANELKGSEKDENGKIIKGDKWFDPKEKIKGLVINIKKKIEEETGKKCGCGKDK